MNKITLTNSRCSASILTKGAELCSFIDLEDQTEHIWSADPKYWNRHAPILFPCIGESKAGQIHINNKQYPMGRHGFARHEQFELVEQTQRKVVLELKRNADTSMHYPFDFVFRVAYQLEGACLVQSFEVKNTDSQEIGFQLGGHPAFAVPFYKEHPYSAYELVFDQELTLNRHLLTDKGLFSGEERPFLNKADRFALSYNLFDEDALVFKNIPSKSVYIQHQSGGKRLQVDYCGFPHLGVWSVPGANYVCIEPWIGCADSLHQNTDFFQKEHLVRLAPHQVFQAAFQISLLRQ